jgi:ABC-type branched-subunit amino acid transport system ATPase component
VSQPASPAARTATPSVVLEARTVSKRFGGLLAVSEVDFQLEEQSIASLIGPNGAGKTTFFNMIAGLYRPTTGEIRFRGRRLNDVKPNDITALGISRTFQNIRLFGNMSALDNVLVGMHTRLKASPLGAVLRTPGVVAEERRCSSSPDYRGGTTPGRATCPTATSGGWRSRGRWRPSRRCCCWTSRRPG